MNAQHMQQPEPEPQRSKHYLEQPDTWSTYPLVPLKNTARGHRDRYGFPEVGILTSAGVQRALQGRSIRIYNANLFALPRVTTLGELEDALNKGAFCEYASIDAMLADGWRVD